MNKQIYIASPLFNEAQIARIEFIEKCCERYCVPYFSPRKDAVPFENCPTGWKDTFNSDVKGLDSSGLVMASLDWRLPDGKIIAECKKTKTTYTDTGKSHQTYEAIDNTNLNIPDPGTVWEISRAYAKGIPVIAHITNPTPLVNIMITESVDAILDYPALIDFFISDWAKVQNEQEVRELLDIYSIYKWKGEAQ